MSDQLNRIEQMLLEMREKMATKEDLESLAKHDDVMAMAETLETIAVESAKQSAATVEDKTEAGYVVLESLFKGLEDRINQRFEQIDQRFEQVEQRFDKMEAVMLEGFKQTTERFAQISDIMRAWVYKQNLVDKELQELKRKVDKLSGE